MLKSLFKFVLLFVLTGSLYSCALSPGPMVKLDRIILSYERAIRWGDFVRAKSFHKAAPTMSDLERRRLKNYRVTSYNVLQNDIANSHNAYLLVDIKYYKNDLPVVKSVTVKQHWKRDEDSEIWYLNSVFPMFR